MSIEIGRQPPIEPGAACKLWNAVLVATGQTPFTQARAPTGLAQPCDVWRPEPHYQCAPKHSVVELPAMEQSYPLL